LALRRILRSRLTAVAVTVLTVASAGVLATSTPASAVTFVDINGAGSTWAANAIDTWVHDVAANGQTVNYAAVGSTTGRQDFALGTADFAASEIPYGLVGASVPPPIRGYAYVPDTAGAVAFMYNLVIGNQRVTNLRLSGAVIAGIFTGQITMWNDPMIAADNPGLTLPAIPVIPVVRTDSSAASWQFIQWMNATEHLYLTAYCSLFPPTDPDLTICLNPSTVYPVDPADPEMVGQSGDTGVSGYVSQPSANGAIGFTEYSYAIQSGFPVAKVLNAAGYYTAPTPGNVGVSLLSAPVNGDGTADLAPVYTDTDPRTYELSYSSYMIVPADTTQGFTTLKGQSLGAFGTLALCQGQQQVDNLGYAALPVNLVEDGYAQLLKVPGASLPASVSAFIAGCANPTITSGADNLASTVPAPAACDQQGSTQCAGTSAIGVGTITMVTTSPTPPTADQAVTLTATVTSPSTNTPAGTVQFLIGSTAFGNPVTLDSSGVASTTETFTTPGTLVLNAIFTPADPAAFLGSVGSLSVTVLPSPYVVGMTLTLTNPPAGAFTFTAPATSTSIMTQNGSTATGVLNPMTITDSRNTYPGWSVVGQATDFTNPASQPAGDISGNQLGWAPNDTSLAPGAVLGNSTGGGLGSFAAVLAFAKAGTGFGTSTFGANLTLAIPPTAPSGNYSSTLTLTADPAGP
jgi:ABC-type phosphate transport system substrate-binding protein